MQAVHSAQTMLEYVIICARWIMYGQCLLCECSIKTDIKSKYQRYNYPSINALIFVLFLDSAESVAG